MIKILAKKPVSGCVVWLFCLWAWGFLPFLPDLQPVASFAQAKGGDGGGGGDSGSDGGDDGSGGDNGGDDGDDGGDDGGDSGSGHGGDDGDDDGGHGDDDNGGHGGRGDDGGGRSGHGRNGDDRGQRDGSSAVRGGKSGARAEKLSDGARISFPDGTREEIRGGELKRFDRAGRLVERRPARGSDISHFRNMLGNNAAQGRQNTEATLPGEARLRRVIYRGSDAELIYSNGWREAITGKTYVMSDAYGRRVITRLATPHDRARMEKFRK